MLISLQNNENKNEQYFAEWKLHWLYIETPVDANTLSLSAIYQFINNKQKICDIETYEYAMRIQINLKVGLYKEVNKFFLKCIKNQYGTKQCYGWKIHLIIEVDELN